MSKVAKLKKGKDSGFVKATRNASAAEIQNRLNKLSVDKLNLDLKQVVEVAEKLEREGLALTPNQRAALDRAKELVNANPFDTKEGGDESKEGMIEALDLASTALNPSTIPMILESTGLTAKSAGAMMSDWMQTLGAPMNKKMEKTYDEKDLDRIAKKLGIPVSDTFQDPYDEITKWRHHDALRIDLTSVSAFETKANFIAGADLTDISIDSNRIWPNAEDEEKEIDLINKHPLYQRIREDLKLIDQDVQLNTWLVAWLINRMGYGRACLLIQDDPKTDLPIALKMLASMRLGKVFNSEIDWKPVAVEYLDYKKPQNILFKDQIIYDANRNYHQSPGSLNYGFADSELFQHIVELNIIINAMDLKEINKRLWAAIVLIRLFTENAQDLTKFKEKLLAGGSVLTALQFTAQQLTLDHDGAFILQERESNANEITRATQVPKQFVGLGGTLTKAEASIVAHAWNQGPLAKERLRIRLVWEDQWYGRNIFKVIKAIALEAGLDYDAIRREDEVTPESEEDEFNLLVHKKEFTKIPTNLAELKEQIKVLVRCKKLKDLPFKIKMEFVPISYETDIERAALVDIMIQDGAFDIYDGLEYMKFDKILQRKKKAQQEMGKKIPDINQIMMEMGLDPNDPNSIPRIQDMISKQMMMGGGPPTGAKKPGEGGQSAYGGKGFQNLGDRIKKMAKGKIPTGTDNVEIGTTTA